MLKIINEEELIKMLECYPKHTFASITAETTPTLNKKNRKTGLPYNGKPENVRKYSEFVCGLGFDYATMITNRLKKEDKGPEEYKRGESWHIPVPGSKILRQHKDPEKRTGYYANVFCIANNEPKVAYFDIETGKGIDETLLVDYLPEKKEPTNQGLEEGNEVIVRTFKVSGIKKLNVDGNEYVIK